MKTTFTERLSNRRPPHLPKIHRIEHTVSVQENYMDETLNRVSTRIVKRVLSPSELAKYRVSDFCLENLQASGAIDNLTSVYCSRDNFTQLAHIQSSATTFVNNHQNS